MFEYDFFDGDHFITFDIIDINEDNNEITVATLPLFLRQ